MRQLSTLISVTCVALLLTSCGAAHSESDKSVNEDTLLHAAADTIVHGIWQPFLPDTAFALPAVAINPNFLYPGRSDYSMWTDLDTILRPLEYPEGGPGDTVLHVVPASVKLRPQMVPLVIPEPKELYPMRSVTNANFDIQYLDVEQGLPTSNVNELCMDSYGRMWMATGRGLICYDGKRQFVFGQKQGLLSDRITSLYFDSKGNLWCGTDKGLSVTNGVWVFNFSHEFSENSEISQVYEDSKNRYWITANGDGVFCFSGDTLVRYGMEQGLEAFNATCIVEDRYGRMWVGAYDKEPSIISGDTIFNTTYWGPLWTYIEFAVMADKDKNLWFSTYGAGLSKVDFDQNKVIDMKRKGRDSWVVQCTAEDPDGNIWIGTETEGVVCLVPNQEKLFRFNTENGLTDNTISYILADNQGMIWVSTLAGGLCRINPHGFQHHNELQGLSTNTNMCTFVDHLGTLYAGFWPGGLYRYENGTWCQFGDNDGLDGAIVLDITEDKDYNLIVSIHGFGLKKMMRIHPDSTRFSGTIHYYPEQFPSGLTYDLLVAPDSALYLFDMSRGMARNIHDSIYWYKEGANFPAVEVHSATQTAANEFWVATGSHGISRIRNGQIKQLTTREGLLTNTPRWPFTDSKGNVWVAYSTPGLTKISVQGENEKMQHFTPEDGLFSGKINAISEDQEGRLWLATNSGIACMYTSETQPLGYASYQFTMADGLKAMEYLPHSGTIDSSGMIWFGTRQGATALDLREVKLDDAPASTHFVSLKINGKYCSFVDTANYHREASEKFSMNGTDPFTNIPQNLELDYFQNNLTFEFSSIHWKKAGHLRFSHRLIGLDTEWSEEDDATEIVYSNLAPGDYRLELRARIEGQEWNEPVQFAFRIHPPWWQTWWFRSIVAILLLLVVVLVFRIRTAHLRKRQQELEQTVKERTAEIEEQKTVIEEKQKETMDSINYAKRIQYTLLAHNDLLHENLGDYFVFFKPKDVVSGDFYWATRKQPDELDKRDLFFLAVCDSTGHGVPGAFMSLLNISFLNEAINEKGIYDPGQILDHTRQRLIENISKEGHQDGMDGILVCFDKTNHTVTYAAGHNAPVLINAEGVNSLDADKMPIGKSDKTKSFQTHTISFEKGNMLFLPTDGYGDQFGGTGIKPAGKKFKRNNLNQLFNEIAALPANEQMRKLELTLGNWKGEFEQVDDITVLGIRL